MEVYMIKNAKNKTTPNNTQYQTFNMFSFRNFTSGHGFFRSRKCATVEIFLYPNLDAEEVRVELRGRLTRLNREELFI